MDAESASSTPDLTSHPMVAAVLAALAVHRIAPQVTHLPGAARTAAQAASALGVTSAEIANSLVFAATTREGTVRPLLVLVSGAHRVDVDQVADLEGLVALERADPSFVREHTGMAIGGVAPVGHPRPIRTIIDVTLGRYDRVWAAAGHSHTVFGTTYDELIRVTGGHPMDVS
ncbi:MAG: YbaK/EbsC family protein [Dermatophilaceae bacterium]